MSIYRDAVGGVVRVDVQGHGPEDAERCQHAIQIGVNHFNTNTLGFPVPVKRGILIIELRVKLRLVRLLLAGCKRLGRR